MDARHARDVAAVISALRAKAPGPVWLVGTRRGTVWAANAAARLKDGGAGGLVLTSSVMRRGRDRRESLDDVDLDEIRVPTPVIHHEQDGCGITPLDGARALPGRLRRAWASEFATFRGGEPPRSAACEGLSEPGFLGIAAEVVREISAFIRSY